MSDCSPASFRILEWDSHQFGFPVGRLETQSASHAAAVLRTARLQGIRLVYADVSVEVPPLDTRFLREFGGTSLGKRITYLADVRQVSTRPHTSEKSADDPVVLGDFRENPSELFELARQAGSFSRFNRDPRVGRVVFEAIYDAWIAKSVSGELADRVLVARNEGQAVGLITMRAANSNTGEIGLLAIKAHARRTGLGRRLVHEAIGWGRARHLAFARVTTQGDNAGACALYEACGYETHRAERTYHFWLS